MRNNGESVKPGRASVMVWGYISFSNVGFLSRIDGIMDTEKYRQIFINHVVPSGKHLIENGLISQHDNDPKQTANAHNGTPSVMDWPPKCP